MGNQNPKGWDENIGKRRHLNVADERADDRGSIALPNDVLLRVVNTDRRQINVMKRSKACARDWYENVLKLKPDEFVRVSSDGDDSYVFKVYKKNINSDFNVWCR